MNPIDQSKQSRIIAFIFIFIGFAALSFPSNPQNNRTLIPSILLLFNFGITLYVILTGKKHKALYLIQMVFMAGCVVSTLYRFQTTNPYTILSLQSAKILGLVGLAQLLLLIQDQSINVEKLIFRLSLGLLIVINTYFILFDWREMTGNDIARHSSNALRIFDIMKGELAGKFFITLSFYDFYQPLTYFVSLPFIFLFGKSNTSLVLSFSLFWLPVGYYYLHQFLGKFYRINKNIASCICFCIFGSIIASSMMRQYMLDFPCLCMVIVYNYAIANSFYLKYKKPSFLAGLIFGLGLLTKASFLSLAAIPFLIAILRRLYKAYKNNFVDMNGAMSNFLLHLLGTFIGGGFWYILNMSHFSFDLPTVTTWFGEHEGDPVPTSLASLVWYFKKFFYYFSTPVFILLLFGTALSAYNFKKKRFFNTIFFLSIIVAYAAATLTWNKDTRTLLPLLAYFPIGFIGLLYYAPKKLILPLLFFLLLWTSIYNLKYGLGQQYPISEKLMPIPYTMPSKILGPNENDFTEAAFIYKKLFKENLTDTVQPNLNIPAKPNLFTDAFYGSVYPIQEKLVRSSASDSKIWFFRDYYWRDYYLYKARLDSNTLILQEINRKCLIGGEMICALSLYGKNGSKTTKDYPVSHGKANIKIPVSDTLADIRYSLRIHHLGPTGQYVQFTYNMLGRHYNRFDVPLMCLTLGVDAREISILSH